MLLSRIESHYGPPGFAASFTSDFEDFLQSVDLDDMTPGLQPYLDPLARPILSLAETLWFGPAETWPRELYNHPYIHFWHRLDTALLDEDIPGMGSEVLGDAAWDELFSSGALVEDPDITMRLWRSHVLNVLLESQDQLGTPRPIGPLGDVGAIETS